jgi:hypothetical protein
LTEIAEEILNRGLFSIIALGPIDQKTDLFGYFTS